MSLRGKKPELIQKRLKVLFYGPAGVGKTIAAIQFPTPYLIDTEKGAENKQYVKLLDQSGGAYFFTFDCYDKLDYLFDLIFEIQKRGSNRIAIIKKTRIEGFPESENFPFSYDEIAIRYGKEILERDSIAQKLATPTQIQELKHFIEL